MKTLLKYYDKAFRANSRLVFLIVFQFLIAPSSIAQFFGTHTTMTVGSVPWAMPWRLEVAHLNGDAYLDLLVINAGENNIVVLLGDGLGGFCIYSVIPVGASPGSLAVTDLNGDGKLDFVTTNEIGNSYTVGLGDGSGSFATSTVGAGGRPYGVAVGDVNGDSKPDLVITVQAPSFVLVRFGTGTGTFTPGPSINVGIGASPYEIALADFNGDSRLDFVTANYGNNNSTVALGDGTGNFAVTTTLPGGSRPFGITIADLNLDGKSDFIISSLFSGLTIALGNGAGSFTTSTVGTAWPKHTLVMDINVDGLPDIIVQDLIGNSVSAFLGNGAGGFSLSSSVAVGLNPEQVVTGDFNMNGKPDFAIGRQNSLDISFVFDVTTTVPALYGTTPVSALEGASVTLDGQGLNITTPIVKFNSVTALVNTYNATAIVTQIPTGATTGPITVALGCRTLSTPFTVLSSPTITSFAPSFGLVGTTVIITGTNFDTTPANNIVKFNGIDALTPSSATATSLTVIVPVGATTGPISVTTLASTATSSSNFVVTPTPQNFITRWDLSIPGAAATELSFETATSGSVDYIWEEISPGSTTGSGSWSGPTLNITGLPAGAIIRLQIAPTNFQQIIIGDGSDSDRLIQIESWGSTAWTSMQNAFWGCSNLNVLAIDVPDLSGVSNMSHMFSDCTSLSPTGNINAWNTAAATDLSYMFSGATVFNSDISSWNVSNVTNMSYMFSGAINFNQGIGIWNTGSVTSTQGMFNQANNFNQDIGSWDVRNVTTMTEMFQEATNFNQNISSWNVSGVTAMDRMFTNAASFNGDIGSWDVSNVAGMNRMFHYAYSFNQDIAGWDVSNVTSMQWMFFGAGSFNQNIGNWDVSGVVDLSGMLAYTPFNQDIGMWDVSNVTDMQNMFLFSSFNQDIGGWNTSNVKYMAYMFYGTSFNQNIGSWNMSNVLYSSGMFGNAASFNQDISGWDMSNVKYTWQMFFNATSFNQDISGWDMGNAILMYSMFQGASSFNQNLGSWNVGNATTMASMLNNSGLSIANYDATLAGWAAQSLKPNVPLGAAGLTYCASTAARGTLTGPPSNWIITGDTQNCPGVVAITSFSPSSGPIGITVTITGTNFDPIPANNLITFNGVTASTPSMASATSLTVVVPAGATTGPIAVTVAGNTATSATNFTVVPFNVSFTAPFRIAVGATPREIVVGDINGDGHLDLVNSNFGSGSISFLKGMGSGCFESPQNFNTGANSHGMALADLNQDSKLDLVVSKANNTSSLSVLLGNGTAFNPKNDYTTSPTPRSPNHVNVGDVNRDGWPDLIVANNDPSGSFSILYNNGNGTFATGVDFPSANGPVYFIATGDVNGDSHQDVAIASAFSGTASIYLNNGLGGFGTETTYPSAAGSHYVVLKDLNGDGRPEMVVANATANSISVFLNNGSGSFSTPAIYPTDTYPTTISVADMDNNSKLDLVVGNVNSGSITVFPGDGAGGFGAYTSLSVGGQPYSVATGDFDEDGNLDIASIDLSGNRVTLLRTLSNSTCIPTITSFTPNSGPIGTMVTITGTNFSSTPGNNIVFFGSVKTSVTAATSTQLTVTVPAGATYEPISALVGGLTAYSSRAFNITFPSGGTFNSCSFDPKVDFATGTAPLGLSAMDFDGDGKVDVAVGNRVSKTIGVYRNTSTTGQIDAATFAAPVILITDVGDPYNIQSGDVDGDGKIDIVVTNAGIGKVSIFRNTSTIGTISFDSFVNFAGGADPLDAEIMDLDGDGKPEIITANRFGNSISIYRNTSSPGGFNASSFAAKVDFAVGVEPYRVNIADLNTDGKPDIVVASSLSNIIHIFQNTSTSGIINASSLSAPVTLTTGAFPLGISLSDMDGDGLTDISVVNSTPHTVSVFRNIASGTITSGSFQPKVDFLIGNTPADIIASDIDGDGKVDLVTGNNSSNTISLLRNTSVAGTIDATSFAPKIDLATGNLAAAVRIADLDGDHKPEVIVTNMNSATFSVFRNGVGFSPVITSFTAAGGPVGTVVTLSGTDFDPINANNAVQFNGIPAVVTASTPTSITVTVPALATTGTITVTVRCQTATSGSSFIVCTIPGAPGTTGAGVCGPGAVPLSATGGSPGEYRWYTVPTGGTPIVGAVNGAFSPSVSSTTIYHVAINTGFCEGNRSAVTATVNPLPAAPITTTPPTVCPGSSTTLTASGTTNGNYRWYDGAVLLPGEVNGTFTTPALSANHNYGVAIFDGTCESVKATITANVKTCTAPSIADNVSAPFIPGIIRIDLTTLITDPEGNLDLSTLVIPPNLPSGATATIVGTELVIDYTGIAFPGTETIEIYVCDLTGQCTQETMTINLSSEIGIFNAVSPNGDGKNEAFYIENIDMLPDTKENKVTIFNRWGDVVFEVINYDNANVVFRGLNQNGNELPSGTYFYKLEFPNGQKTKTGFISLRK